MHFGELGKSPDSPSSRISDIISSRTSDTSGTSNKPSDRLKDLRKKHGFPIKSEKLSLEEDAVEQATSLLSSAERVAREMVKPQYSELRQLEKQRDQAVQDQQNNRHHGEQPIDDHLGNLSEQIEELSKKESDDVQKVTKAIVDMAKSFAAIGEAEKIGKKAFRMEAWLQLAVAGSRALNQLDIKSDALKDIMQNVLKAILEGKL